MFYYEVAIASKNRSPSGIFTYASESSLPIGSIVTVPLRSKEAYGFIVKESTKPTFKTHAITSVFSSSLPKGHIKAYLDLCALYPFSEQLLAKLFLPFNPSAITLPVTAPIPNNPLDSLNDEQAAVHSAILSSKQNSMLHGDTGTGKTRIYTHLIEDTLNNGKSVVLLAPEIGLATLVYNQIANYFPSAILYHSELTPKKRKTAWEKVANTKRCVIVGPRSALMLPAQNIGLIILDEAHDASYRQDGQPYLHAKVIASLLAKYHGAKVVYGTATPNVSDLRQAKSMSMPVLRLTKIATGEAKSSASILDTTDTSERLSGGALLRTTVASLKETFASGQQALILTNKRGTARYVSCSNCSHEERCTVCDHLLVYHHDKHRLMCHFCQKTYTMPQVCSECGEATMTMRSHGTKAIALEITKLFPSINVHRFDTDNKKDESMALNTKELINGEIQCVVGTQMIAKGLDLPHLKTLVVLGAGAYGPGYTSEEKEFQLLYQVLGRAMRGHQDSTILIQTTSPDSKVLKYAVQRDYDGFYNYELASRERFNYPPFCFMMLIHFSRKSAAAAEKAGKDMVAKYRRAGITLDGPVPNTTERVGTEYRWHIVAKSSKRSRLVELAQDLGASWICELDPIDMP